MLTCPPTGGMRHTGPMAEALEHQQLDRRDKALVLVDRQGTGLAIGPCHDPIAPKAEGFDVRVVDHLDTSGLREKYARHPVDVNRIEEVDFVWHGEPLPELVGGQAQYDWIIASHVFEHLPDPISFLTGCEQVLRPGGVVSLVIPDKRYCYDRYRPLATTGAVLDAHARRQRAASPGNVFDETANAVHWEGRITWTPEDATVLDFVHRFGEARTRWLQAVESPAHTDVHLWQFVPDSFRLLVHDLRARGLIGLGIRRAFDTTGHEFHVTLGTVPLTGSPQELDRLALLRSAFAGADASRPSPRPRPPEPAGATPPCGPCSRHHPITMEVSDLERRFLLVKRRILEAVRSAAGR